MCRLLRDPAVLVPRGLAPLALVLVLAAPPAGAALTEEDFRVRNAQDLVDLCSSPESDPLNDAADHFCHGYLTGAWHYHEALANGPEGVRLVCPPNPAPTRDEVVAGFVAWAGQHPEYMNESGTDALFRYLTERAPCAEEESQ
jgi:hypothetical protein